jgi:hypothetical protein
MNKYSKNTSQHNYEFDFIDHYGNNQNDNPD